MRFIGRFGAAVVGVFGFIIALIVNFVFSVGTHVADLFDAGSLPPSHGFIGLLLILVALIGAFIALPTPRASALLLLIAGIGFFYPVHLWALFASPFFLIAAALAWFDRNPAKTKTPTKVASR